MKSRTTAARSAPSAPASSAPSRFEAPVVTQPAVDSSEVLMRRLEDDGTQVINIYSAGQTELGRFLSNFSRVSLDLPAYRPGEAAPGRFASIEGYWYWLGLAGHPRRDELRDTWGLKAKQLGRELRAGAEAQQVEDFEGRIRAAITHKVRAYPRMAALMRASTLPFVHVYAFKNGLRDAGYRWIVDHMTQLRAELQAQA